VIVFMSYMCFLHNLRILLTVGYRSLRELQ